jgi:hypothetical protein
MDLRSSTANLTQELAQLLAQSIAQGQAVKHTSGAAAAGAQFSNLVALVSTATQTQRGHQPSFKDGLSSLSYARPAAPPPMPPPVLAPPPPIPVAAPMSAASVGLMSAPAAGLMAAPSGLMALPTNGLLISEPHDEEPMPIPSTWRQPTLGDDDRWYRQQLGAAGLGLLAGLVVVVPAVLWLSGFLGGSQSKADARRTQEASLPAVKVAEIKPVPTVKVATISADTRFVPPPVEAPPVERVAPPQARAPIVEPPAVVMVPREPVRSRADDVVAQAKRRIESNDVAGARDILQGSPETRTSGALNFLLAETYDPNMLASWQTRGVMANPELARSLYQKARDLGDGRAQQRLEWLTAN